MSSPSSDINNSSADELDDPLDGKPSDDAKLTHVRSCSSLPTAGDDLDHRQISTQLKNEDDNFQLGNDTLIQLLANASALLTPSDLALAPNDPRAFMPTPFAPGQSARTLMEQERQRKEQQEKGNAMSSPQVVSSASTHTKASAVQPPQVPQKSVLVQPQMMIQLPSPIAMQPQLQWGGNPHAAAAATAGSSVMHQPFIQRHLQPQPILQQQQLELLALKQQLAAGGFLSSQQMNSLQRMYSSSNQPLITVPQPNINGVTIPAFMGVGFGLPQLNTVDGTVPGLIANNATTNDGSDATGIGLTWLLQQQQRQRQDSQVLSQLNPFSQTTEKNITETGASAKKPTSVESLPQRKEKSTSYATPRSNRWNQRYNELLEFRRKENVSCLYCYWPSFSSARLQKSPLIN